MISDLLQILQKQHSDNNDLFTLWMPRATLSDQLAVVGMLDSDLDKMLGSDAGDAAKVSHVKALTSARLLVNNMTGNNFPNGVVVFSGTTKNDEFVAALGPSPIKLPGSLSLMDKKFHVPA